MKVEFLDTVPRSERYKLQAMLDEFAESDKNVMCITFTKDDYKTNIVARNCWVRAVEVSKRPYKVKLRGDRIYISKE